MKKIKFHLLLILLMAISLSTSAYDFMVDGLCYIINEDGQSVTVTYEHGPYTQPSYSNSTGELIIPQSVEYNYTTYRVSAIGISAFDGCRGLCGSLIIPNSVTSIGNCAFRNCSGLSGPLNIPNSITTIGGNAFEGCTGFTSLSIPNSVITIGYSAFEYCSGFTGSLTIPNSVTTIGGNAFKGCSGLTETLSIGSSVSEICSFHTNWEKIIVDKNNPTYDSRNNCNAIIETKTNSLLSGCKNTTIPNSVTSIGVAAFYGCSDLTGSINLPNSVTSIGSYAFYECSGLTGNLTIPSSLKVINSYAFYGCSGLNGNLFIPNSVININKFAFAGCSGLSGNLTIPNSVLLIDEFAFEECSGFSGSLDIPSSVKKIHSGVFSGCSGLTGSLTIPNSVTSIGGSAFDGCSRLTSLIIPKSVTNIVDGAFSGCCGLATIQVASDNPKYDSRNNCNAIIDTQSNNLIVGCKNTIIPKDVTYIKSYAFTGCSSLTTFSIPNSVRTIGDYAFADCIGLTSLTIPNSVITIGSSAFSGCSGLTKLSIPNTVRSIGELAFSCCSGLSSVAWNVKKCADFTSPLFDNCPKIKTFIFGDEVEKIPSNICNNLKGLNSLTIGNSVTSISNYAFSGCSGLSSVKWNAKNCADFSYDFYAPFKGLTNIKSFVFGDGVEKIPAYLCYRMTGLSGSLTIPNSVTTIGDFAFSGCSGFTGSLTIPNSVTSIGGWAFSGCSGLQSVLSYNLKPDEVECDDYSFEGLSCPLLVPLESVSDYRSAKGWKLFKYIYGFGDLDGNEKVDVSDVDTIIDMVLGKRQQELVLADINGDGIIDVSDVNSLIDIVLGRI